MTANDSTGRDRDIGRAFASRSISLRLYPHQLEATPKLDELQYQAALACSVGFEGVMLSERHGGAWGQIPNPLQAAGWLLTAMPAGWVAPCPLLLPFRLPAIVAEELSWLDARFPGRVGAGFGAGGNAPDFALVDVPFDERARLFDHHLRTLVGILCGADPVPHAGDPAIDRARRHGIPLVSAAMGTRAVRRAAELGIGIIGSSLLSVQRSVEHVDEFHRSGGRGPYVMIVRVWVGDPPIELMERQFAEYQHAASGTAPVGRAVEGLLFGDPSEVASRLIATATEGKADALNIRVHIAGLSPTQAREQIELVGREVLPLVRARWT